MIARTPGMQPQDPPPGGLAKMRLALAESDRASVWVERSVVALATALLMAVLPELLFPAARGGASGPALSLATAETAWQALPSSDPKVKLYVAMPVVSTSDQ